MKFSGRVSVDTSVSTDAGNTCNLSASELRLLDHLYKKMLPLYRNLCDAYEKAKIISINTRRKLLFPSRTDWQPVGGFKDTNEHLLIQGPKPNISEKKKLAYEDVPTGKKYVFMSIKHDPIQTSGRHLRSIVQVLQEPDGNNHTVAYINRLFTHKDSPVEVF